MAYVEELRMSVLGVDTKGKLIGNIESEVLLNFIREKYDKYADLWTETNDYGALSELKSKYRDFKYAEWRGTEDNTNTKWVCNTANIYFKFKNSQGEIEDRRIFCSHSNINTFENIEYYNKIGLREMVMTETTGVILGAWGSSVEIMRELVTEFGGWIDEKDCDDEDYYFIEKSSGGTVKPVIRVTMREVEEKFGGTVIITDYNEIHI